MQIIQQEIDQSLILSIKFEAKINGEWRQFDWTASDGSPVAKLSVASRTDGSIKYKVLTVSESKFPFINLEQYGFEGWKAAPIVTITIDRADLYTQPIDVFVLSGETVKEPTLKILLAKFSPDDDFCYFEVDSKYSGDCLDVLIEGKHSKVIAEVVTLPIKQAIESPDSSANETSYRLGVPDRDGYIKIPQKFADQNSLELSIKSKNGVTKNYIAEVKRLGSPENFRSTSVESSVLAKSGIIPLPSNTPTDKMLSVFGDSNYFLGSFPVSENPSINWLSAWHSLVFDRKAVVSNIDLTRHDLKITIDEKYSDEIDIACNTDNIAKNQWNNKKIYSDYDLFFSETDSRTLPKLTVHSIHKNILYIHDDINWSTIFNELMLAMTLFEARPLESPAKVSKPRPSTPTEVKSIELPKEISADFSGESESGLISESESELSSSEDSIDDDAFGRSPEDQIREYDVLGRYRENEALAERSRSDYDEGTDRTKLEDADAKFSSKFQASRVTPPLAQPNAIPQREFTRDQGVSLMFYGKGGRKLSYETAVLNKIKLVFEGTEIGVFSIKSADDLSGWVTRYYIDLAESEAGLSILEEMDWKWKQYAPRSVNFRIAAKDSNLSGLKKKKVGQYIILDAVNKSSDFPTMYTGKDSWIASYIVDSTSRNSIRVCQDAEQINAQMGKQSKKTAIDLRKCFVTDGLLLTNSKTAYDTYSYGSIVNYTGSFIKSPINANDFDSATIEQNTEATIRYRVNNARNDGDINESYSQSEQTVTENTSGFLNKVYIKIPKEVAFGNIIVGYDYKCFLRTTEAVTISTSYNSQGREGALRSVIVGSTSDGNGVYAMIADESKTTLTLSQEVLSKGSKMVMKSEFPAAYDPNIGWDNAKSRSCLLIFSKPYKLIVNYISYLIHMNE